jgi:hypothetical protein
MCPLPTPAAEEPDDTSRQPWALGIAAQLDDESSASGLVNVNWGVAPDTWLSVAAGRSRSPSDRADVSASSLRAGVDHLFGRLGVTFEAERWGDPDALEATNLGGSMYVQGARARLGLEYETRAIDIVFSSQGLLARPVTRTVGFDSDGYGVSFRVDLTAGWRTYGSFMTYDYSRNVSLLPRVEALNLLSASALTLANSFVDKQANIGLEWESNGPVVNIGYARDRSAVDRSEFRSLNGAVLFGVGPRIDLEFNIGKSNSNLAENAYYGGVLLLIYGG